MAKVQRRYNLLEKGPSFVLGQFTFLDYVVKEFSLLYIFHNYIYVTLRFNDLIYSDNMRVLEYAANFNFSSNFVFKIHGLYFIFV